MTHESHSVALSWWHEWFSLWKWLIKKLIIRYYDSFCLQCMKSPTTVSCGCLFPFHLHRSRILYCWCSIGATMSRHLFLSWVIHSLYEATLHQAIGLPSPVLSFSFSALLIFLVQDTDLSIWVLAAVGPSTGFFACRLIFSWAHGNPCFSCTMSQVRFLASWFQKACGFLRVSRCLHWN